MLLEKAKEDIKILKEEVNILKTQPVKQGKCSRNCVLRCLASTYNSLFNAEVCDIQLLVIIIWHYSKKKISDFCQIPPNHQNWEKYEKILINKLRCGNLLEILKELNIIQQKKIFEFSPSSNKRERAWGYIISECRSEILWLALKKNPIGHCVITRLDKTDLTRVVIEDPQINRQDFIDKEKFTSYLSEFQGLEVYPINIEKFKAILPHTENLHFYCPSQIELEVVNQVETAEPLNVPLPPIRNSYGNGAKQVSIFFKT